MRRGLRGIAAIAAIMALSPPGAPTSFAQRKGPPRDPAPPRTVDLGRIEAAEAKRQRKAQARRRP